MLDEKHVLEARRRAASCPPAILARKKQPYRAPDALAFVGDRRAGVGRRGARASAPSRDAGVFDPRAVAQLWAKCRADAATAQFSNADNMALVGVLSTQLLHRSWSRHAARRARRSSSTPSSTQDRRAIRDDPMTTPSRCSTTT